MASSSFDPAAVAHSRHLPVESAMPGTTLQLIPLSTFSGNGALYGAATHGMHLPQWDTALADDCVCASRTYTAVHESHEVVIFYELPHAGF